jgi:hypothetical protein
VTVQGRYAIIGSSSSPDASNLLRLSGLSSMGEKTVNSKDNQPCPYTGKADELRERKRLPINHDPNQEL